MLLKVALPKYNFSALWAPITSLWMPVYGDLGIILVNTNPCGLPPASSWAVVPTPLCLCTLWSLPSSMSSSYSLQCLKMKERVFSVVFYLNFLLILGFFSVATFLGCFRLNSMGYSSFNLDCATLLPFSWNLFLYWILQDIFIIQ